MSSISEHRVFWNADLGDKPTLSLFCRIFGHNFASARYLTRRGAKAGFAVCLRASCNHLMPLPEVVDIKLKPTMLAGPGETFEHITDHTDECTLTCPACYVVRRSRAGEVPP